jgi:hypothetical protein
MAVYKVPQDVEADDKLIGPFSFRQFIYLIIVAIAIAIGWGLSRLFVPLAIIPLPIVVFFGALALPLRKDQPMEIYMAAIVSFYLKPRKRLWRADGIQSLVEITAPKVMEVQRVKDLSQSEAERRLSYLADIVDTGGWAIRGVATQSSSPMQNDVFFEAQQAEDILATDGGVARSFESMITESDQRHRQEVLDRMHENVAPTSPMTQTTVSAPSLADPYATLTPTLSTPTPAPAAPVVVPAQVNYNPYPSAMHQSMVTPLSEQRPIPPVAAPQYQAPPTPEPVQAQPIVPVPQPEPVTTSEKTVSPDIISLANNPDLSIETIARQANRIHQLEADEGEVVISLR